MVAQGRSHKQPLQRCAKYRPGPAVASAHDDRTIVTGEIQCAPDSSSLGVIADLQDEGVARVLQNGHYVGG